MGVLRQDQGRNRTLIGWWAELLGMAACDWLSGGRGQGLRHKAGRAEEAGGQLVSLGAVQGGF